MKTTITATIAGVIFGATPTWVHAALTITALAGFAAHTAWRARAGS